MSPFSKKEKGMPKYILKVNPDEDLYVCWSTVVDAPTFWGTKQDFYNHDYLIGDVTDDRFERADKRGTSAFDGDGEWGDKLMYMQYGMLDRKDLKAFLESYDDKTGMHSLDLIQPFEDYEEI